MAGAGVNADVIAPIYEKTGITDYHMTGKVLLDSEMKYRKEGVSMGLPSLSEYEIFRTSEAEAKRPEVLDEGALSQNTAREHWTMCTFTRRRNAPGTDRFTDLRKRWILLTLERARNGSLETLPKCCVLLAG